MQGTVREGPPGWSAISFHQIHKQVAGLARRLQSFGVGRGTPVAIVANTSERWTAVDMAVQCLGGITVGIYPTLLPEQIQYQLEHSEAKILIVEDEAQAHRCFPIIDGLFDLQHILSLHACGLVPQLTPAMPDMEWLADQIAQVRFEDVCTYICTSGTTGSPKAVVLNHHNFTSIIDASRTRLPLLPGDHIGLSSTGACSAAVHSIQRIGRRRRRMVRTIHGRNSRDHPDRQTPRRGHTVPRMLEKNSRPSRETSDRKKCSSQSYLGLGHSGWARRKRYALA